MVDWLRGIQLGLNDRLIYDLKEFMEDRRNTVDDIKLSKSLDQARLCNIQV